MTSNVCELVKTIVAGKQPGDAVFTWSTGNFREQPIVDNRVSWDQIRKAAGVSRLLFHDFRRTGVRNMIRPGFPSRWRNASAAT